MSADVDLNEIVMERKKSRYVSQNERIVEMCLESALRNPEILSNMVVNAGQMLADRGYPLQQDQFQDFNAFLRRCLDVEDFIQRAGSGTALADIDGIGCTICKISVYSVAILITAVGAAGLTVLTEGSAPVIALAAFLGVSATASLAVIAGMAAVVVGGIDLVASYLCEWTQACT